MSKQSAKSKRSSRRNHWDENDNLIKPVPEEKPGENSVRRVKFECRTPKQIEYRTALESKRLIFSLGPAGTGKTYVATSHACKLLIDKRISHIIVTRPAVNAEEEMGFLPGELEEKWAPYFRPFKDVFLDWFSESALECMLKRGTIEIAPLGFIRGRTFENAFVILDEAQNTTCGQMKLFLTRIGQHSTVVVDGDVTQQDIKGPSGLEDAILRFRDMPESQIVEFTENDVVRDGIVREILKRYRK